MLILKRSYMRVSFPTIPLPWRQGEENRPLSGCPLFSKVWFSQQEEDNRPRFHRPKGLSEALEARGRTQVFRPGRIRERSKKNSVMFAPSSQREHSGEVLGKQRTCLSVLRSLSNSPLAKGMRFESAQDGCVV